MSGTQTVICARRDRIGARLRNLVAGWAFADAIGAHLTIQWQDFAPTDGYLYEFTNFFDRSILDLRPGRLDIGSKNYTDLRSELDQRGIPKIQHLQGHSPAYFRTDGPPELHFDQSGAYVFDGAQGPDRNARRSIFYALPLNRDVQAAADAVLARLDLSQATAVHIRRGDLVTAAAGRATTDYGVQWSLTLDGVVANFCARYAPNAAYVRAISQLAGDGKLVLFSDDTCVRQDFTQRYGARVIDIHAILDGIALNPAQRAFAEFLLIARTRQVICAKSAFAFYAAELGDSACHSVRRFLTAEDIFRDLSAITAPHPQAAAVMQRFVDRYVAEFLHRKQPDEAALLLRLAGRSA